jgi:hypothetical protein
MLPSHFREIAMLRSEQNELPTRTAVGTPTGNLLRSYWQRMEMYFNEVAKDAFDAEYGKPHASV